MCPCGSGKEYDQCCGPFHDGRRHAVTAEELMRSRYSAFVELDTEYLLATYHPRTRPPQLVLDETVAWRSLRIIRVTDGGLLDATGTVEFVASFRGGEQREKSWFERMDGKWLYVWAVPNDQ